MNEVTTLSSARICQVLQHFGGFARYLDWLLSLHEAETPCLPVQFTAGSVSPQTVVGCWLHTCVCAALDAQRDSAQSLPRAQGGCSRSFTGCSSLEVSPIREVWLERESIAVMAACPVEVPRSVSSRAALRFPGDLQRAAAEACRMVLSPRSPGPSSARERSRSLRERPVRSDCLGLSLNAPWPAVGAPSAPVLCPTDSWLLVPLLLDSTGCLAIPARTSWRQYRLSSAWWATVADALGRGTVAPVTLIGDLRHATQPIGYGKRTMTLNIRGLRAE